MYYRVKQDRIAVFRTIRVYFLLQSPAQKVIISPSWLSACTQFGWFLLHLQNRIRSTKYRFPVVIDTAIVKVNESKLDFVIYTDKMR